MNKYEIYSFTKKGTFKPTGLWVRAKKLSHIEEQLNIAINNLKVPCIIVISKLTQEDIGD